MRQVLVSKGAREEADELVGRDELQRKLWPDGTPVDVEHGLKSAVNRLREALTVLSVDPEEIYWGVALSPRDETIHFTQSSEEADVWLLDFE